MGSAESNSTDDLFRAGEHLADGKYEIVGLVGAGGMGRVYRARHTVLRRKVAIKVLNPDLTADPKIEARFLREARATSLLDHRNAMQILDFGTEEREDGSRLAYIVMEFLDGRELSDIVQREGPLETQRIAHLASQVCAALFVAHEQGVIHRDLKPENIMILPHVDDDGRHTERVKVCDFGIAKIQSSEEYAEGKGSKLTEAGEVFGTPFYMSPEQARGKRLDPRADVYSLGVVLFELATAKLPFVAEHLMGVLAQQMNDPPPRPSEIHPAINPLLETIILRCLEKNPDRRYQSVRDLRVDLQLLLDDRFSSSPSLVEPDLEHAATVRASTPAKTTPLELAQTPTGEQLARRRRSPAVMVLVALLVTVVAAAGVYILAFGGLFREPATQAGGEPTTARAAPGPAPVPAPEPEPEPEPERAGAGASARAGAGVGARARSRAGAPGRAEHQDQRQEEEKEEAEGRFGSGGSGGRARAGSGGARGRT
jgi:serine/threonine-protein kinase